MRNYAASENPHPRKWRQETARGTIGHKSDADHGWSADRAVHGKVDEMPVYLFVGSTYLPLRQLPQRIQLAIEECVEKFIRCHPTPRGV